MRILLVEDDRQLATSMARGLREAAYAVEHVETGPEAVGAAGATAHDVIILDLLLPGMNGLEVCQTIRAAGSRVPILMLTALDAVEHRIAGLNAGADDYLSKPFDFGELLARVRALSRRRGELVPDILEVADLRIDTLNQSVRRGTRLIALTGREYAFLLHLARNAGRVVSRAELMAHVWDDNRPTYTNVIDVYASRLRKKVDEGEAVPLFITHRGTGYMLDTAGAASSPGS